MIAGELNALGFTARRGGAFPKSKCSAYSIGRHRQQLSPMRGLRGDWSGELARAGSKPAELIKLFVHVLAFVFRRPAGRKSHSHS
jgi:hypothetical protein